VTVLRIAAVVTLLATVYAFVMPQTYTSTVTILPPKKEERGSGLMDMLSGAGAAEAFDLGGTLGFGSRPSDIFVKILSSRTVSDSLIRRHRLVEFFGISPSVSWRHAGRPLADATVIESSKDGMISVSVSLSTGHAASSAEIERVKRLAADIANDYVYCLDVVNRATLVSTAKSSRIYIQQQLVETRRALDTAYAELVAYQEAHRAVSVDKQLEALVTTAATLKTQLAEAVIELGVARRDMRADSRAVQELQARVEELQKQYARLQDGQAGDGDFVMAFLRLPRVARDLAQLVRSVKSLEEVNAFLNRQYYRDRLQEARDLPTVQVLDPAIPAWKRTAPRRMQWMLTSAFIGLLAGALTVLARDAAGRRRRRR
jgi:uncharacterized protein involved in exopolysaccharide biosynthesis